MKFQEALKTYEHVRELVFQLLYPSYNPWYVYESLAAIPVNDELFDPILKIGEHEIPAGRCPEVCAAI